MYQRLHTLIRLLDDSLDDYDLSFGSPEMDPGSPEDRNIGTPGDPDNIYLQFMPSWYWR